MAAASGVVAQVDNVDNSLAGRFVAIEHSGGVVTRYMHNTKNLVVVGQRVDRGETIATLGQTGTSGNGTPHVHFDVKLKAEAFQEYLAKFGSPTPGFTVAGQHGIGVPAEALMSGASYRPKDKRDAQLRNVSFHSAAPIVGIVIAGVGIGLGFRYWPR